MDRDSDVRSLLEFVSEANSGKIGSSVGMIGEVAGRMHDNMVTPQSIVPTLQIMNGPMAGRLYKLDREVVIVGRNPECDVVLQPKSVSRKHAAILRTGAGFEIKDLGSTRGTFLNGQRLTNPSVLNDGNLLQI